MILRIGKAHPVAALAWRFAIMVAAAMVLVHAWNFVPQRSGPDDAAPRPANAAPDGAATDDHAAIDKAASAAVAERPLFYPSRTPWAPPPPPPPAPPTPPVAKAPPPLTNYALVGVIVSGDTRSALIRPPGAKKIITIGEGEELAGWKLQEITRARLRFAAGAASYEMNFPIPSKSPR